MPQYSSERDAIGIQMELMWDVSPILNSERNTPHFDPLSWFRVCCWTLLTTDTSWVQVDVGEVGKLQHTCGGPRLIYTHHAGCPNVGWNPTSTSEGGSSEVRLGLGRRPSVELVISPISRAAETPQPQICPSEILEISDGGGLPTPNNRKPVQRAKCSVICTKTCTNKGWKWDVLSNRTKCKRTMINDES